MPDFDDIYASAGFEDALKHAWSDVSDTKERKRVHRELAKITRELLEAYEAEGFTRAESTEWAMFILGLAMQLPDDDEETTE